MRVDKIGYLPALDGLRAIAIFLVILTHANFQLGANGILGVDIFFALSGFLITTLLLEENYFTNKISLTGFYIRRIFRLFPALYLMLFIILLYALIFSSSIYNKSSIITEIVVASLYLYNISWYFGLNADGLLLGHTWSLAVEEQFYLIWPIILILTLKYKKLKAFSLILTIFILVVFLLKITGKFSPLANAIIHESIFIGCLAAIIRWLNIFKINLHSIFPTILLLFIIIIGIFPMTWYMDLYKLGGKSLIALLTVVVILYVVKNPLSLISKILSNSFLVYIGKISYALYLWHIPIFRWFKWHSTLLPWQTFMLKILFTFIVSIISFALIETKFTRFGRTLSKKI